MAPLLMAAVSFALLVDEIMLSAIFHVLLGAGNTVAALSIALVGLSASGIAAWLLPAQRLPSWIAPLVAIFAASQMACAFGVMAIPMSHGEFPFPSGDVRVGLTRLAAYHLAVVPFFLGGLTLNAVIRCHAGRISRLYFADLAGAALGCAASPWLLSGLGASRAVVYAALPAALVAALLLLRERGARRGALLLLPLAMLGLDLAKPDLHRFSVLNTLGRVDDPRPRSFWIGPEDLEFEAWALDAWTIVRDERIPPQWEDFSGWGLSPRYRGPVPRVRFVNFNARYSTYVTEFDGDFAPLAEWLDSDLGSFHHHLGRRYEQVLNIGAGGGREVLSALHHDAGRVVAVDVSRVVVEDLMKAHLSGWSGDLYRHPRVIAVADEGRSFAERTPGPFDLVEFSLVGGANLEKMDLVRVDDLFTLEALRTYLSRLSADGVFSYMMYSTRTDLLERWMERGAGPAQPYVPALRTLSAARTAFEEAWPGRRFADHVLVAGLRGRVDPSYELVHIVVSRSPFSDVERQRFAALCRELDFVPFHPAADAPAPAASGAGSSLYARLIRSQDLAAAAARLPFSTGPLSDDRPFQVSPDRAQLRAALADGSLVALLAGNPLVSLAAGIGALTLVVMAIPLASIRMGQGAIDAPLGAVWPLLLLFACIGFAYMAVEIAVLLKIQFYLGRPIYGLAVALFGFLLASGLGSNATGRLREEQWVPALGWITLAIAATGLAFFAVSPALFAATLQLPIGARIGIAVASIFPVAFPMGMLFPIGVKLLSRESEAWIPWAWALNGGFSVLGIFGTRLTALFLGFSRALLIGLAVYGLGWLCLRAWAARRPHPA